MSRRATSTSACLWRVGVLCVVVRFRLVPRRDCSGRALVLVELGIGTRVSAREKAGDDSATWYLYSMLSDGCTDDATCMIMMVDAINANLSSYNLLLFKCHVPRGSRAFRISSYEHTQGTTPPLRSDWSFQRAACRSRPVDRRRRGRERAPRHSPRPRARGRHARP